jgi:SHS2 domain-containing protein
MIQHTSPGFEVLDHPADLGISAWGASLPELFVQCARAFTSVLIDLESIEPSEIVEVQVMAEDLEFLLYNWLSELIYRFDGESWLFSRFEITSIERVGGQEILKAELRGEPYDATKHQMKTYVKAITMHQLKIETTREGYYAEVYFDI